MKQVITFLVLSFLIAGSVYAAQIKSNETVCNANELLTYNTSRYVVKVLMVEMHKLFK